MKATLPESLSTVYSIRIGSEDCRVRGIEIEPIEAIFSGILAAERTPSPTAAPWADVTGPDELIAERMSMPPVVRKRSRLVASRAILLGDCD